MTTTQEQKTTERVIEVEGVEVTFKSIPSSWDEGEVAEFQANIEGMVKNFRESKGKGEAAAQHYFRIVTSVDPQNVMGHSRYYTGIIKEAKDFVRATVGIDEASVSRYFSKLREALPDTDPWYLDPNRTEHESGGPAKGTTRKTSQATETLTNIEDPDAFTIETLVQACRSRLAKLDPKELSNAVGFVGEVEDLAEEAKRSSQKVQGFIRQQP